MAHFAPEYSHTINKTLNKSNHENNEPCFLYSNISKYCQMIADGGYAALTPDDFSFVVAQMNILAKEIAICKPHVVVFLTGPSYDEKIRFQFDDQLEFKPVVENIPVKELARVRHPILPHNSFRTYHPNAFRFGFPNHIPLILNQIQD